VNVGNDIRVLLVPKSISDEPRINVSELLSLRIYMKVLNSHE